MRARGFTLVELTVVILLLGLMASIVVPRALSLRESGLSRESGAKIVAAVQTARELARSRGQQLVVGLDSGAGRVSIAEVEEDVEDRFNEGASIPGQFTVTSIDRTETEGLDAQAASGETLTVFFEDGTAEPATAELTVGPRSLTLRVAADGTISLGSNLEPAPETEKWQAGDLENRA